MGKIMSKPKIIKIICAAGTLLVAVIIFTASYLSLTLPDKSVKAAPVEDYTGYLKTRLPELMKRYDVPGLSIALVKDGQTVRTDAFGYADKKAGILMTADTPMRVQSISKSVTAWGIMKLAEEGKIDLNEPVGKYITSWEFPKSEFNAELATIKQLLSHTAGLPLGDIFALYSPTDDVPSLRESLYKTVIPVRKAGEGFSYSNVGYNLLELLIEEVSGKSFSEYMESEILNPLGMGNSTFVWSESITPAVPKGYNTSGKEIPVYVYPEKASGGLFSTAADIAAFLAAGMPSYSDQTAISSQSVETLYEARSKKLGVYSLAFDAYGSGYYMEELSGNKAVSHGGQGTGFMSHFHAVPGTGDGIVILTNSQRSWPLIAAVLHGWASWLGFDSPQMTRILLGESLIFALSGAIFCLALIGFSWIAYKAVRRKLSFAVPGFGSERLPSVIRFVVSAGVLAFLAWCLTQKYLFITSVFPSAAPWLGISAAVLALALLVRSFLRERKDGGDRKSTATQDNI